MSLGTGLGRESDLYERMMGYFDCGSVLRVESLIKALVLLSCSANERPERLKRKGSTPKALIPV